MARIIYLVFFPLILDFAHAEKKETLKCNELVIKVQKEEKKCRLRKKETQEIQLGNYINQI